MQMYKYANLQVRRPVQSQNVCLFFSVSTRLMAIGLVLLQDDITEVSFLIYFFLAVKNEKTDNHDGHWTNLFWEAS